MCYTFNPQFGPLPPGDYTIPFEFDLPANLPASIMFQKKDNFEKPKAIIKYSVTARIINHDKTQLQYKQMLVLHEPPVAFQENTNLQQKVGITVCCCCDKGSTALNVQFNKNVFYGNEICAANVAVDNHECKSKINSVSFEL